VYHAAYRAAQKRQSNGMGRRAGNVPGNKRPKSLSASRGKWTAAFETIASTSKDRCKGAAGSLVEFESERLEIASILYQRGQWGRL
jgi:hypothetical protein